MTQTFVYSSYSIRQSKLFKSFESYESFIKYELGSGSFHSVVPLPLFNSVKVRLWIYCVRFCQKVLFTNVGSCWLVGCFGFNGPLRQYFSLYRAVSQRQGERRERIDESKNVQTTPTRTRPCPTVIKIVGRPGTGSLPSTIAPPDHPLDPVHHPGLRLALGAFRTSPITSLYVEADEPSLYLRREKLSLQYAIKLAVNPSNPAFRVTFSPQFSELFDRKPHAIKPFGLRVSPLLESSNINPKNIERHLITNIPPWCLKKPNIIFDLNTNRKSISNPHVLKQNFQVLQSLYAEYQHVYTDGSKDGEKVGCAFVSGNHSDSIRIPDGTSVFTAEAKAIDLRSFGFIDNFTLSERFVIFSDSLSVLKALNHTSSKNSQIQIILEQHHEISKTKEVIFCWIPGHVNITGNETADRKAKESLKLNTSMFEITSNNFKPFINNYVLSEWQASWDTAVFNKFHAIKPNNGNDSSAVRNLRREEVVITRLRIGHTRITHSYLLNHEEQPFCIVCNQPFTVKHILIDCIDFL